MNDRQLKKQDKKAMAILIGAFGYKPDDFALNDEGTRVDFWWRCSYEYDEWDSISAYGHWLQKRNYMHPNFERWWGFDPDSGEPIPEDKRPRPMGHREARAFYQLTPPPGYRWRGNRVVKRAAQAKGVQA